MSDIEFDSSWSALAAEADGPRQERMTARCREVADLADEERLARVVAMVRAEYALDEAALEAFTVSRLRAWLTIESDDPAAAARLAGGYDAVFNRLPAAMALRRASVVQHAARHALSAEEVDRLFGLIPSIVQQVPRAKVAATTGRPRASLVPAPAGTGGRVRPWWRFWGR